MAESTESGEVNEIEADATLYVQALENQIAAQAIELARLNFMVATMSASTLAGHLQEASPSADALVEDGAA